MNLLQKINPFKKKSIDLDTELHQNHNNYLFQTFGNNQIVFDNYVKNRQNDCKLIEIFNSLAEISAPITKYSKPATQIKPYLTVKKGNKYEYAENHWLNPIVQKYFAENFEKHIIYKLLLGNVYINAFQSATVQNGMKNTLTELILLPSQYTFIKTKLSTDFRLNELLGYEVILEGQTTGAKFTPQEILHIKNNNPEYRLNQYLYGISNLVSCARNIRSIESGYGAKVGLYEHGPRVIITGKIAG